MPKALVEAARERDFPLFEVPYELPFIAITEKAFTRLVNEQYALLQRSIAAQERLQRIVLSERGLDAIVGALATLIGGAGARLRRPRRAAGQRTFRRELDPEVVAALARSCASARAAATGAASSRPPRARRRRSRCPSPAAAGAQRRRRRAAAGVARRGQGPDGLAEIDRLILHQAVTVVALELLRRRVADTTERRLAGDVLTAIIAGELEGAELGRRLSRSASAGA